MERIAVIGAGGHARETIDAARAAGHEVIAIIDENEALWGSEILNAPVLPGGLTAIDALAPDVRLVVAIGDNPARRRVAGAIAGRRLATLIHPFSWISPGAAIGEGVMIFAGTVVQTGAVIGAHVIVNTGATVSHDCRIGDFSHIAVGAHLAGNVTVGEGVLIGAGATARPGVRIGDGAIIGAGAAVVSDIPPDVTAYGSGNARPR